jgi:transcriptional regulator with XRE-family HTH domain/tetratricopeptide (TPR) repeat protein
MSQNATAPGSLGRVLRQFRLSADLTLEALAERSGISDRAISDIERGVSTGPQRRTVEALAQGLALTEDERRTLTAAARAGRHRARSVATDAHVVAARGSAVAPRRLPDFTGRDDEVHALSAFLAVPARVGAVTSRVAVISGPPGVGKTTLAVESLHRRSDVGQRVFVDLGGLDPEPLSSLAVIQSLLRQLVPGGEPPMALDEATERWRRAAAEQPLAVLLDNAANEAQVRPALTATDATIVVTSRRSLSGLEGVRRIPLGPLVLQESIAMLRAVIPPTQAATGDLGRLARLCDNMPLALRIAGNRLATTPSWTVDDLVGRLGTVERRLRTLVAGDLAVESAFALSYDLLPPELADVFRALSLLEGPTFDARLVALLKAPADRGIVSADVAWAEDALDELSELGLVQPVSADRYRLHDLLRAFAASRLARSESEPEIERRRLAVCTGLLELTAAAGSYFEPDGPHRRGGGTVIPPSDPLAFTDAAAARRWLEAEVDHWLPALHRAAASGHEADVVATMHALHWFSDLWTRDDLWLDTFGLSAECAVRLGDASAEAEHLGYVAWANLTGPGGAEAAVSAAEAAASAARRAGDRRHEAWAEFYTGWALNKLDQPEGAAEASERAARGFAEVGDAEGELESLGLRGLVLSGAGRLEEAIVAYRDQIAAVDARRGNLLPTIAAFTRANALLAIANLHLRLGRMEETIALTDEARGHAVSAGFTRGVARSLFLAGRARGALGDRERAHRELDEAATTYESVSLPQLAEQARQAKAELDPL